MSIRVDRTPNPSAMKYTIGVPVGGPATYTEATGAPPWAADILGLDAVQSVFATADFVTVTAHPDAGWDAITQAVITALEGAFGRS